VLALERSGLLGSRAPSFGESARFPVAMAAGKHPFPFRTRQLSPPAPMVLGGRPPGRVGRRRDFLMIGPLSLGDGGPIAFGSRNLRDRSNLDKMTRKHLAEWLVIRAVFKIVH
jgi:hypothetical protein